MLVQTPQQKAYNGGSATPREHFGLFLLPYPLKNMTTGAFSSVFAPVPVQTLQQKAYNRGSANPWEHFCHFLLPCLCRHLNRRRITRVVQTHGYVLGRFCDRGFAAPATEGVYQGSCKRMATFWAFFVADPLEKSRHGYVFARFCVRGFAAPATGSVY